MRRFRLAPVRSGARIAAVAILFAMLWSLTTPFASAAPTATGATDLAVTVLPQNQVVTIPYITRYYVHFEATVVNSGPSSAGNVVLTATAFPTALAQRLIVSASIPCAVSGDTATCAQSSLPPAAAITLGISFWAWGLHGISYRVTATVCSATPDPISANNTASGTISFNCSTPGCYLK